MPATAESRSGQDVYGRGVSCLSPLECSGLQPHGIEAWQLMSSLSIHFYAFFLVVARDSVGYMILFTSKHARSVQDSRCVHFPIDVSVRNVSVPGGRVVNSTGELVHPRAVDLTRCRLHPCAMLDLVPSCGFRQDQPE